MAKTLTTSDAGRLSDALRQAFPSVHTLEELLLSQPLDKQFDDFTSRSLSLKENSFEICKKGIEQGWGLELFNAARAAQPDNPALRALWDTLGDVDLAAVGTAVRRSDRPSLLCGRSLQWNEVCQIGPAREHDLMLIVGELGQDPAHFQERIRVWLAPEPHRSVLQIDWPTRPACRDAFFEPLALALGTSLPGLKQTMADRLASQNLVLLHDCVRVKFDDENLIKYYTVWLPELLEGCPNLGRLKCVQPIEWHGASGPFSFVQRLWSSGPSEANDRDGALRLIAALQQRETAALDVVGLEELTDLTEAEIGAFVKNSGLTATQQEALMKEVHAVPQVPAKIFEAIDASWNQVQTVP